MYIKFMNRVHNYSDDLIRAKIIETKNIFNDEKNFKDVVIYFTRFVTVG